MLHDPAFWLLAARIVAVSLLIGVTVFVVALWASVIDATRGARPYDLGEDDE